MRGKGILVPLTRFCLQNPIATTLFYILLAIAGIAGAFSMGRNVLPPVSLPAVSISAPYAGAAPAELERLVIEPIEDRLAALPDLEHVDASAQNGDAEIVVQFRFGSSIEADESNVQQAVDAAQANMPADLLPPLVSRSNPTESPVLEEAISSALVDPGELSDLLTKQILPVVRAVPGVGTVQSSGAQTRQFTIRPRADALEALNGTLLDVFRAAQAGNDVFPGGVLRSRAYESSIGIDAAAVSKDRIESLPLSIPANPFVRIADAADVDDGYADRSTISRIDGAPAILVYVTHASGSDALRVIAGARTTFERLAQRYPRVRFDEVRTDQPYTNAAIDGVFQTLSEGIALTVVVTLLFLHAWRNALITAIAIPASLCAAFATMWALGISMNVLSLMGLSLTIGILVDDSIVIIEAISRNAAAGLQPEAAALAGRKELGGAAFAITLVDVAVFLPIALMSGIVGEFMREFALVIVIATAFSLLISLTLTPLLAAHWALRHKDTTFDGLTYLHILAVLRSRAKSFPWTFRLRGALHVLTAWHALINAFNAGEHWIAAQYAQSWLPAALRRPRLVVALAAAACAASFLPLAIGAIPTEFSPPINRGTVTVDLRLPAGTPLAATDAAALRINDALLDDPAVKHVEESAGRAFNGNADVLASNVAQLNVILSDSNANGEAVEKRVKALSALLPAATIVGAGRGMGGLPEVSYTIGGDPAQIDAAAARIAGALRENSYATDVRTSDMGLQPRLQITLDMERARLLGVSPDDAAQTARIASGGDIAAKARLPSGLVNVVVRSDAAESGDTDALGRFAVRSRDGRLIPLEDLSHMTTETEPTVIAREDGSRVVTVSANALEGVPISLLTSSIVKRLRDPAFLPPGTRVMPRGDIQQFFDTVSRMFEALILSLASVYVILAVLYRSYMLPLVIMLTVPLASAGAFGTLFALNALRLPSQTLNLYSMLGVVMLVGLVAKNGILIVEYAERAVRDGARAADAAVHAAQLRFRPIVMTTLAMIAGMIPLAAGATIGAEYRRALGTVVIGGLSSSLLLTLFVVPVAYVWYRRADSIVARRTTRYAIDGREIRRGA